MRGGCWGTSMCATGAIIMVVPHTIHRTTVRPFSVRRYCGMPLTQCTRLRALRGSYLKSVMSSMSQYIDHDRTRDQIEVVFVFGTGMHFSGPKLHDLMSLRTALRRVTVSTIDHTHDYD